MNQRNTDAANRAMRTQSLRGRYVVATYLESDLVGYSSHNSATDTPERAATVPTDHTFEILSPREVQS